MIYNLYRTNGSIDYSTPDKKELEWYMASNSYRNIKLFDINGRSIPFKSKVTIGTKSEIKIAASLTKLVASASICGRQYYVGKGASLLKIIKYDDRTFSGIIATEKGKKKAKWSFSLAR